MAIPRTGPVGLSTMYEWETSSHHLSLIGRSFLFQHHRDMKLLLSLALAFIAIVSASAQLSELRVLKPPRALEKGKPLFEALEPKSTGIDFKNPIDNTHPLRRLYISGFSSGGIAVGDVDGDGWPDVYLTRGPGENRLYRQKAPFQFEDITAKSGVAVSNAWSAGAALADVNGDGHLDLYVCVYDAPNRLFINDGKGRFTDTATASGVAVNDASLMVHFQDYDGDGDLDFYLLTNRLYRAGGLPKGETTHVVNGKRELFPEFEPFYELVKQGANRYVVKTVGREDRLFRNDGTGKFEDVTQSADISGRHYGLSATWLDYDHDGCVDLYVANDFQDPDRLYRNQGDGTFEDVIKTAVPHTTWYSMGSDAADLNNDGKMDLMVVDMSSTSHYKEKVNMGDMSVHQRFMDFAEPRQLMRNAVFLNSGTKRYLEAAHQMGLASTDWSWAVKLADYDNDGLTDVFVTNGMTAEITNADLGFNVSGYPGREEWDMIKDEAPRIEPNLAYRNQDGWHFDEVGKSWGLNHVGMSLAAAYADLDRDGNLDLIVSNLDDVVSIYRNRGAGGHRVTFEADVIGVTLRLRAGNRDFLRVLNPATGYMSSNQPLMHIGLGAAKVIDELEAIWPDGTRWVEQNLEADRHYQLTKPSRSAPADAKQPKGKRFASLKSFQGAPYQDRPFDDFATQPLLPNKLSQLGPGLAVGDMDGDGDEDLVMGGARDYLPVVHFKNGSEFRHAQFATAKSETRSEDMASLLFDADRDGDLDWYIASGGVESGKDAQLLQDRLYINVSPGAFSKAEGALPVSLTSSSTVSAADIDRDGDLDLFVGGRVIPGQYPIGPGGRLLRNDSQTANQPKFTDVTKSSAPSLAGAGMVTSALWSDYDDDGWIDLLVATEWGPIRVYQNEKGQLKEVTKSSGLDKFTGWWNGLAASDFDHDGDIDYVATNFGHNTKYHPTAKKPSRIYYGTFGNDSKPQIIEAKLVDGELLPVRGKSCSQNAMPFITKKFETYHAFAAANLTEIYTPQALQNAEVFEVNTLASSVLINEGNGRFRLSALPDLAQIAPGFGVVSTEVNGDGHPDIYIVQNFYTPQRETGKMSGGLSALLLGNGKAGWRAIWPDESGLFVPGDGKGLAMTDLNDDGWPDFAVGINNGYTQAFANLQGRSKTNQIISVVLQGKPGNPSGVGAKISLERSDGHTQTAEVHAGGSYLSQSTPTLFFGLGREAKPTQIVVRWPDGKSSKHPVGDVKEGARLMIKQPD